LNTFFQLLLLSTPLFATVGAGYAASRIFNIPERIAELLNKFCYAVLIPVTLFRLMSQAHALPGVDARLLAAYFGSCLVVFILGRVVAARMFAFDSTQGSVFALGGVFSNIVLLGLPLAKVLLGEAAVPSVALIIVFNALTLWTLVTISIEWGKHGSLSLVGIGKTARGVLTNPIVASILAGTLYGYTLGSLPAWLDVPLKYLGLAAAPAVLVVLGMGLAQYPVREGWRPSVAIAAIKVVIQPLVVLLFARLLNLPPTETQAVVLTACMATGVNVYMMARQFGALQNVIASTMVLTTALAAITTPFFLSIASILARQ
jgi:malonate transporter and related proteins